MKTDKRLQTTVKMMALESFNAQGVLEKSTVKRCVQGLKKLPLPKALGALRLYVKHLKRETEQRTLRIETVVPLSRTEVEQVTKLMRAKMVVSCVDTKLRASLLGGIRLKMGDVVYDDSVMGKIRQLRET